MNHQGRLGDYLDQFGGTKSGDLEVKKTVDANGYNHTAISRQGADIKGRAIKLTITALFIPKNADDIALSGEACEKLACAIAPILQAEHAVSIEITSASSRGKVGE